MIKIITALLFLFAQSALASTSEIEDFISHNLSNSFVGVVVQDANSGEMLYQRHGHHYFTPASVTKMLTAAAALSYLGPEFTFETAIFFDKRKINNSVLKDNIVINFNGDPSFTAADLTNLLQAIKKQHIKQIDGNIYLNNSAFNGLAYSNGSSWEDKSWYFDVPVDAIIIDENYKNLTINAGKSLNAAAHLTDAKKKVIASDIKTVSTKASEENCQLLLDVDNNNKITAGGCWPIDIESLTLKTAIKNPFLYAKEIVMQFLQQNGITLNGEILLQSSELKDKNNAAAVHYSAPLKTLLISPMQLSKNVHFNSLLKTLGKAKFGKGDYKNGTLAVRQELKKLADIEIDNDSLHDGAGASRYNLVTPMQVARLLYVMRHHQHGNVFQNWLAVANSNGTLKNRMFAFDVAGVNAKTGSLKHGSSLAGFNKTTAGREIIFVTMINNSTLSRDDMKQREDILSSIIAHL